MTERKAISKKTRFELFKRDAFTCVYCGRKPPEIILHVDHVIALAAGGADDIDNMVTSCDGCNLGKGARDITVLPKSLAEKHLELREREDQLVAYQELQAAIRDRLEDEQWLVAEVLTRKPGLKSYPHDKLSSIRRFIQKLGLDEVMQAADMAAYRIRRGDYAMFKYFCGICWKKIKDRDSAGA